MINVLTSSFSGSQSADDSHSTNHDSQSSSSSSNKKRKVLSFSEYLSHKKPISSNNNSTDNKLTVTQIEEIYASFDANIKPLAVNASDLATNVNKKLTQKDHVSSNRNGPIANDSQIKSKSEQLQTKVKGFWDEDDDDDDDAEEEIMSVKNPLPSQKQPVKKSSPPEKTTTITSKTTTSGPQVY